MDGRIYFAVPDARELRSRANVTIESLRALKGVLDNEMRLWLA